jgi:hypothetical protein
VGKTRLVDEFANHLRWQGIRVWGAAMNLRRPPYQPVADALHTSPSSTELNWRYSCLGAARSRPPCAGTGNAFHEGNTREGHRKIAGNPGPHSQPYPA